MHPPTAADMDPYAHASPQSHDDPRAATAFVELSGTNQVLVLTCHQWMVDLFTEAAPDAAVIDLSAT